MKPAIEIKGLSKVYNISHEKKATYGKLTDAIAGAVKKPLQLITGNRLDHEKFWALKDIDLEVNQGEVIGIIGRNGSGKSTLLKILSQIVDPTEGEVTMHGKVASLLEVGTGFHPELTGRENIYFNGAILGMSQKEIREKFNEIVEFSEVEQFLDTPVKFYSSGMYVRLAFAVAAHLEPDILIVDEVLAVGDAAFQKKSLGKMKDVAGSGRTVLFVSHNMASIKTLCNKAIWLDKGIVKAVGPTENVSEQYMAAAIPTTTDLAKRPRTTPVSGEAMITSVRISNVEHKGVSIDSSKPVKIEMIIKAAQDIDNVVAHVGVSTSGQMISVFMSEFTKSPFRLKAGLNKLTCLVRPTNLTGGLYSIGCSILHPGREATGHIDEIEDAVSFTVSEFCTPNKQYLTQREAAYYVDHSWSQT